MNPFKSVDEIVRTFVGDHNEGGIVIGNIVCWLVIYHVLWGIVGLLGPYFIMLLLPVFIVPLTGAMILWFFYNPGEDNRRLSRIWYGVCLFLGVFLWLNGIPGLFFGSFFKALRTKAFLESYWAVIVYWWKFFNAINFWADDGFPHKFYAFNLLAGQWVFIVCAAVGVPYLFLRFYEKDQMEFKEREKRLEEARKKAEAQRRRAIREAEREEKRKREEALQEKIELERQDKQRRQKKEATDQDPWDSGFL